jgi:hypothetical protein
MHFSCINGLIPGPVQRDPPRVVPEDQFKNKSLAWRQAVCTLISTKARPTLGAAGKEAFSVFNGHVEMGEALQNAARFLFRVFTRIEASFRLMVDEHHKARRFRRLALRARRYDMMFHVIVLEVWVNPVTREPFFALAVSDS